jgi:hypothetical protein
MCDMVTSVETGTVFVKEMRSPSRGALSLAALTYVLLMTGGRSREVAGR